MKRTNPSISKSLSIAFAQRSANTRQKTAWSEFSLFTIPRKRATLDSRNWNKLPEQLANTWTTRPFSTWCTHVLSPIKLNQMKGSVSRSFISSFRSITPGRKNDLSRFERTIQLCSSMFPFIYFYSFLWRILWKFLKIWLDWNQNFFSFSMIFSVESTWYLAIKQAKTQFFFLKSWGPFSIEERHQKWKKKRKKDCERGKG